VVGLFEGLASEDLLSTSGKLEPRLNESFFTRSAFGFGDKTGGLATVALLSSVLDTGVTRAIGLPVDLLVKMIGLLGEGLVRGGGTVVGTPGGGADGKLGAAADEEPLESELRKSLYLSL
jgi:hypothetical protein